MSDFGRSYHPKAAKNHRCEWCGETIHRGEIHYQFTGVWEGDWQNWRMHEDCFTDSYSNGDYADGFTPFENKRPTSPARCDENPSAPGASESPATAIPQKPDDPPA